ncbi:MAG TPA: nucleotidyltransferase family protein [Terriglobales bacterium]|nr:nucleotidyltransferase family protein [Terriglobales bacterium]
MRAMILAAGFGSRLRPLTDATPKPLIEVAGRPMIAYALALVRAAGITEVGINLHHLGEQIRAALGDGSDYGVRITYFPEDPILDTGGGIEAARSFLASDRFVVLNADTVAEIELSQVIEFHLQRRGAATLVLRPDPQAERYGTLEIDDESRIRRILKEPRQLPAGVHDPLRALMFAGIHVIEARIFDYMQPGSYSITRATYPAMLAAGEALYGYVHHGFWQVLDTHEGLAAGSREIAARFATLGPP